ncbi:MAG: hypothetical protein ING69_02565 [Rhodocyclaceae bacterium]|nr:hypothetical protein [Rhodocyclaceae bacterium]MCA3081519.1 hypothetical protein [Rhodocyclaceae bacterium]
MAKASARRAKCDQALYKDIYEQNDKRMACRAFAVIYRYAVKTWGDDKFLGADAGAVITQSREEYEKAIRDFFENGTEEQFKRIVEEDAANRQVVNMKRNIGFSKEKGLVNVK